MDQKLLLSWQHIQTSQIVYEKMFTQVIMASFWQKLLQIPIWVSQRLQYSTFFDSIFEKQRGRVDLSFTFVFQFTCYSNFLNCLLLFSLTAKLSALGFSTKILSSFMVMYVSVKNNINLALGQFLVEYINRNLQSSILWPSTFVWYW